MDSSSVKNSTSLEDVSFFNMTSRNVSVTNSSAGGNDSSASDATFTALPVLTYSQEVFIKYFIGYFYQIIMVVVGCLGNSLVIAVLMKKKNRQSSTAIFLSSLAVCDILILLCYPLSEWLAKIWDISFRRQGSFGCKTHVFLSYVCPAVSSWILVMVTIERVISVTFPHKVKIMCSFSIAWIAVAIAVTVNCGLNAHFLWGLVYVYNEYSYGMCGPINEAYSNFGNFYLPWIDFLASFAVPCLVFIIGNTIIVRQLSLNRKARRGMTTSKQTDNKNNSVTVTLIIVNVAYVLTQTPLYFLTIGHIYWYDTIDNPRFILEFWSPILNALAATNAAINFALYFLSGSRFSAEVKELLGCTNINSAGWFNHNTTT